jgi:hypothetical protein
MTTQERLSLANLTRVGSQLGTNPASIYENNEGDRFYLKMLESPMHARNEWIAAQLYKLTGAPVFDYIPCEDNCHIATRWQPLDKRYLVQFTQQERRQAQHWLAVHAWTANWDAAGFNGDNQGCADGRVLTLDVGGALYYRAHGDPKGQAFGTRVSELDSLRTNPENPHAVQLFADMTNAEIRASIQMVTQLADDAITKTIRENGGSLKLAEKMLARKADLALQMKKFD